MDYTNNPSSNQHPNQHDYDQLETIYSHLDSTTTVSNTPASIAQGDFDAPVQWGRLVKASNHGRALLYERDFGRGYKLFTFVFPAE
jgi:hypothetical protein